MGGGRGRQRERKREAAAGDILGKRAIKWTEVEVQPGFLGFSDSLFEALGVRLTRKMACY